MTKYKYNVGDDVAWSETPLKITYRYKTKSCRFYICRQPQGTEETYLEEALHPIPSTPLDANNVDVGIGDLVRVGSGPCVYRVAGIKSDGLVEVRGLRDVICFPCDHQTENPKSLRIIEKAPPKKITLGSRVRLSGGRAQVFTVVRGHIHDGRHFWASGDKSSEAWNETCLELIE